MNPEPRRQFLKNTVKAGLFLAVINPFRPLFGRAYIETGLPSWAALVELARWCPTVHNLQPHKLKIISETEAELYYDPARLLPVGDPEAIFTTVALGIFVEHLSIAASPYNAAVTIEKVFDTITTTAKGNTLFARLNLTKTLLKEKLDPALIQRRKTSRGQYNGKPLKPETAAGIQKEAALFGHEFSATSEKEFADLIIDLNQQTLFEDLESKENREELYRLFRYTKEEAANKKDGLWATCMGFSGKLMKSVFRHHDKWSQGLRRKLLAGHYKASFKGTNTICWFSGKFENTHDWLNAGQMLARTWLLLTKENAYLQPFGSLITNQGAYQKINETFPQPESGKKIWLVFRAGYSPEPARSYRLETNDILLNS